MAGRILNARQVLKAAIFVMLSLLSAVSVEASEKGLNFQVVIKRPDGTYPTAAGLTVTLQILDPISGCVLREEEHSSVNLSNGYMNLVIGNGSVILPPARNPNPTLSLAEVFENSTPRAGLKCVDTDNNITAANQTYTPLTSHGRKVRLRFHLNSELIVGDFNIRDVAFASNAEALGGKAASEFIQKNSAQGVTQTNLESVFSRYAALDSILSGTYSGTASSATTANTCTTATTATNVSGTVAIGNGGTGATTAAGARTALGLGTLSTMSPTGTANATTYLRGDGTWAAVSGGAVTSVATRTGAVTLTSADLTDFATAVDSRADTRADARIAVARGANNGVASLGAGGKVPSTQLSLVASDIPSLDWSKITSGKPTTISGYAITDAIANAGGVASFKAGVDASKPVAGSIGAMYVATDTQKLYRDNGTSWDLIASHYAGGGGGSATTDAGDLTSGTLAAGRLPAFTGDVTSSAGSNSLTLGTVPLTKGGTGLTAAGGANKVLGMNAAGTTAEYKDITAGTGVTVTHSAGGIQIAATGSGGTVTSIGVAVPAYMTSTGGPVTGAGSITLGFGSQSAKQVFAAPSGAAGAPTFRNLEIGDVFSSIGGLSFLNTAPACSGGRALTYVSATDRIECADLTLTSSQVTTALGFTPANGTSYVAKAGDTMTGALNLPANGLVVGTNQLVASGGNIGIGTASPINGKLDIAAGTQTTSLPVINATETWNAAGTTFTAAQINITDIASATASKLLDLQVGGVSKFSVDKTGKIVGDGSGLTNIPANGSTFLAADGTAAAPGFAFNSSGNNDNGMFLPAANELGFSTSGSERIRINSAGKIGINAAPYTSGLVDIWDNSGNTATLNIQNQSSADGAGVNLANNSGNVGSIIAVGGANTWDGGTHQNKLLVQSTTTAGLSLLSTNASGPIALYTGGAASTNERMRIDASGKVGIGTASPAGILDVQGGTAAAGTAGAPINITAQNGGAGNANGGDIVLTVGAATGAGTKGAAKIYGRLYQNGSLNASGTSMHEVNMGLAGTTTTAFGVNVDPYLSGTATADLFTSFIAITPTVGTGTLNNYVGYAMADSTVRAGYTRAAHFSVSSGANRYNIYADGTADNYFAGKVGIGTTGPAALLDVAGNVKIGNSGVVTCDGTTAGSIRYDSGNVEFCNGSAWTAFAASGSGITSFNTLTGSTQTLAIGTAGNLPNWDSTGTTHTLNIPMASSATATAGLLSHADYASFSGKVSSVDVAVPAYMTTSGGPITSSGSITLGFGSQAAKQVFAGPTGASGAPTFRNLLISDIFSSIGGLSFLNTTPACTSGRALTYVSATDRMECADLSLTSSQVTTALGFTPANGTNYVAKAGDTMNGPLSVAGVVESTSGGVKFPDGTTQTTAKQPYVIGGTLTGTFADAQILTLHPFPITVTIPAGCTNSRFEFDTAATASTTITLKKCTGAGYTSCTSFGTAVVGAGGKVASFTCAAGATFTGGADALVMTGPGTADTTAANAGWAIYGTR